MSKFQFVAYPVPRDKETLDKTRELWQELQVAMLTEPSYIEAGIKPVCAIAFLAPLFQESGSQPITYADCDPNQPCPLHQHQ